MADVMITGASAGLGAALATVFARRGDRLFLVARRRDLMEAQRADLLAAGAPAVDVLQVDLSDPAEARSLADRLEDLGIDVLVNNAALGHWDLSWDIPLDRVRQLVDLNVGAVAMLSTAFAQRLHTQPARLMNVASGAGYALFDGSMAYCATKFFVTAFTEGMARELRQAGHPMRAQLLAPGPIQSEFMTRALDGSSMEIPDIGGIEFHTPEQVAAFAMELFDSDADVGAVQADMSFVLSGGIHAVGQLFEAD